MVRVVLDRGHGCNSHTGEGQSSFQPCKPPICFVATLAANGWLHVNFCFAVSWWTKIAVLLQPILKLLISFLAMTTLWWDWNVFLAWLPRCESCCSSVFFGCRFCSCWMQPCYHGSVQCSSCFPLWIVYYTQTSIHNQGNCTRSKADIFMLLLLPFFSICYFLRP